MTPNTPHNPYTDTHKKNNHKNHTCHPCLKISPPLSLMPTLLLAPTPCPFSLTRTLTPHQGKHRCCPSSHRRSRQCPFDFLILAAWMYSPLPPINEAQPLTRSKVKSLASPIIQFHTNTSISIKAASSTARHLP
jgi:hypothetical protein